MIKNSLRIKNLKFKNILVAYLLICLFAYLPKANAQNLDIGIYPPIFQIQTVPPSDVKIPFSIENFTNTSVSLGITLKPFTAADSENGQVNYLDNLSSYADPYIFDQVRILDNNTAINSITLAPKQTKKLNLEIFIPENEQKGEYYFSLVFYSSSKDQNASNLSQASGGISSNILLTVGPIGKTQGVVENFSSPFFVNKGPVPFTVRVKNTSDHFITTKGNIVIKNMYGQTIGKIDLLPVNILSNTIRRVPDQLQSPATSEKDYQKIKDIVEKNQFPVAVWPEKFLLGPYTATLYLALSDEGPEFIKTVSFFAFPAEYLIAIIILILIVSFIILRVMKKIRN